MATIKLEQARGDGGYDTREFTGDQYATLIAEHAKTCLEGERELFLKGNTGPVHRSYSIDEPPGGFESVEILHERVRLEIGEAMRETRKFLLGEGIDPQSGKLTVENVNVYEVGTGRRITFDLLFVR